LADSVRASAASVIEDDLIHVFHRSCGAYGHFILDGLCAVAILADLIRDHHLKILVPTVFPAWVIQILASVGFGPARIVKVQGVARCRSLSTSTMLMGSNCFLPNPATIAKLRMVVSTPAVQPSRRIYLTRDDAHSPRFVENEAEVQAAFTQAGFEVISPTRLNFRKQVELFASAKTIAGNHGSALTNMIFASPSAQIIDLMPEDWIGYWGDSGTPERWLLNLTAACGLDYALVLSKSNMTGAPYLPNSSTELARIDTTVDLDSVRTVLSLLS
jgi:capsular polysaccharide biosynthesis protein